ncbi:MAG TPA: SRPBCC family protein [Longimicrobiaceae bacterium]
MGEPAVSATALIPAAPPDVYAILADYREGHDRIIPRPPFVSLEVEQGGVGAGTVIRVRLRLLGRVVAYRAVVTEPVPGRILAETNENGYMTSFTVERTEEGGVSRVTIATETPRRGRVATALERWLLTRLLRPVYVRELELLAGVAAGSPS